MGTLRAGRPGRPLGTGSAGITLVAFVALFAFITFVTLFALDALLADSAIVGLDTVLVPESVSTDGPGCAGLAVNAVCSVCTVFAVVDGVGLAIAESDGDTCRGGLYVLDYGAAFDQLLKLAEVQEVRPNEGPTRREAIRSPLMSFLFINE